jgi:hypothetical protein
MAMLMPHRVNSVLRRRRHRFFHANPVNDSWEAIRSGRFLENPHKIGRLRRQVYRAKLILHNLDLKMVLGSGRWLFSAIEPIRSDAGLEIKRLVEIDARTKTEKASNNEAFPW